MINSQVSVRANKTVFLFVPQLPLGCRRGGGEGMLRNIVLTPCIYHCIRSDLYGDASAAAALLLGSGAFARAAALLVLTGRMNDVLPELWCPAGT